MVSIDQITNGILLYMRDYLIGQIPKDNYRFVLGNVALEMIGASIIKNKQAFMNKLMDAIQNNPFISMIDIVDANGMIDIDAIKTIAPKYIQPEGFRVRIPLIGPFSIMPSDIDAIYNCIINSPVSQRDTIGGGKQ